MDGRITVLYHFCRLRWPRLALSYADFQRHLQRSLQRHHDVRGGNGAGPSLDSFLENLHPADWYLSCACLERDDRAWEALFQQRASRVDCLLVDALRARAVRLFPGNETEQEQAVGDFWGHLLAGEKEGRQPALARYDGQAPLVPWLIRVFQNKVISEKRRKNREQPLPEDELGESELPLPQEGEERWHEEFRLAAREWLGGLSEDEQLLLGLRMRYRLSQREVAKVLNIHEGNVTRRTDRLRDRCREEIGARLTGLGWTGDDLQGFILKEMAGVLMDDPRLSVDVIVRLLAKRGKRLPDGNTPDEGDY